MGLKALFLFLVFGLGFNGGLLAQEVFRSFELRYYSPNVKADGETDFKGSTAYFDTEKRIEYLQTYEKVAGEFFDNKNWDQLVISDDEAKSLVRKIKAQPLPLVRDRILLEDWNMLGFKPGKRNTEQQQLDWWNQQDGVEIVEGQLHFTEKQNISKGIGIHDWRSLISLDVKSSRQNDEINISLGDALQVSLKGNSIYVNKDGRQTQVSEYEEGETLHLKFETDLESGKYNLYLNEAKIVDFMTLDNNAAFDHISLSAAGGTFFDNLYVVKYTKSNFTEDIHSRDIPYKIHTVLNEKFSVRPAINNWQSENYDDGKWMKVSLPFAHGGDRFKEESMYLRKNVDIGDFSRATLNIEAIDPGGEIWINGEVLSVVQKRTPFKMDISEYLKPDTTNILGILVFPNKVEQSNRHTSSDIFTGCFAGRAWIDLHQEQYIKDVFAYTKEIDQDAIVSLNVEMQNDEWEAEEREIKMTHEFNGFLKVQFYKWFPEESAEPVYENKFPVNLRLKREVSLRKDIILKNPELWHFDNPNLYKVVVTLLNEEEEGVDDYVLTTGIRTVSQEGGTFRINGEPEMMNGALLFGYKYPLEDIARTIRCADDYWLLKEIMMMKRGNGNTLRMSVHHGSKGGINDPRLAEMGDQLGIMFQWTTGTWVRTGTPWIVDFEALPEYVRQVRNHPSIIMWQPGNHPKFKNFDEEASTWINGVYNAIYPNDPSRLISATANNSRFGDRGTPNDAGTLIGKNEAYQADPVWTAPMITRGNMDHTTGYGAEWSTLRKYPVPPAYIGEMGWREKGYRMDYLESESRAYFDFESEESIGQPNWTLRKGKPSYRILSYELNYNLGSIGRKLSTDEWRISQAWQGFSAFEAAKKKRWLDYDGIAWCTLHGGGNTATYQKPLIDYYGYSKIVFHTLKMGYQDVLACSKNVDIVYGPGDKLPLTVINLGDSKLVDVRLVCRDLSGKKIFTKKYSDISLEAGRSVMDVDEIELRLKEEGYYIFEYIVE